MDRTSYFDAVYGGRDLKLDQCLRRSLLGSEFRPMQVDEETARFLAFLTGLSGAKAIVELGGFVGYSAYHIASAMPEGGHLTSLEINPKAADLARANLDEMGMADKVTILVEDAQIYLSTLGDQTIDFIFIDAEKSAYPAYLAAAIRVLRPGGLLVGDDCYPDGNYDAEDQGASVKAINSFNLAIAKSPRLRSALIGTGHGVMVAQKL